METRNVSITFEKAKEWYNSDNESLKEIALQAFEEDELKGLCWKRIKTFEDAYRYLRLNNLCLDLIRQNDSVFNDSYVKKVLEYQIIVAALTNNEKRHLTTGEIWFPVVQFCRPENVKNCFGKEIIGEIMSEGKKYLVVGGRANNGSYSGLGYFYSGNSVSYAWTLLGFRSVSSKEIAEHISKYFGKLLFEIQYRGTNCDWKWID